METISYLNLKVDGTPITKLTVLEIMHAVNQHGMVQIEGEASLEDASRFVQRADETTKITITTTAKGQPQVLFCGVVATAGVKKQDAYALLQITLKSTSYLLDTEKQNKSFQNTGSTHEEILKQVYKGKADLTMQVSDKPIGSLIMQYNETPWEFTKRIVAIFEAPVVTNLMTPKPEITIGIPNSKVNYKLQSVEYDYGLGGGGCTGVTSNQYVFIGDKVSFDGQEQRVKQISASMVSGVLRTTVYVADEKGFSTPSLAGGMQNAQMMASSMGQSMSGEGVGQPLNASVSGGTSYQTSNAQVSGKMFTGIVKAVKKDKVQVHLTDIDSEYDGGGNYWFPYSTAYSSSDGSGFYCMPAEGDTVRVFFPSGSEGDAFAASSVNVSPLDNPKHKKWRSPAGKEILLTEEGLFITCKENKIFINLTQEDGITISSEKDISICSKSNVVVVANKQMMVQAENNILLSTAESYIDMKPQSIEIGAANVTIS